MRARRVRRAAQVDDFWQLYVHMRRPQDDRPTVCDYHVFREGIKPMWEDDKNINGGKWIVRLKKGVAQRYWEDILMAVLGGQLRVGPDEICGAVLSVRYNEDLLSIWNKSADNRKVCMQIRDTMRSVMGLPENATMEYKKHTDAMRDNSSYRNAQSLY
jgi:translation initiation factor 4E